MQPIILRPRLAHETDDTARVQEAIAAANVAGGGKIIIKDNVVVGSMGGIRLGDA